MKQLIKICILFICISALFHCRQKKAEETKVDHSQVEKEAREDSTKLALAIELQSRILDTVVPLAETDPVQEDANEDAADDPAIWFNESYPGQSLVFGTNKKSGIHAYELSGKNSVFYALGKINNIDIRQQIKIGDEFFDILGGSNRTDNSVILYSIDSLGKLNNLLDDPFLIDSSDIDEVYGFCLYKDTNQKAYVLVNGKNGRINQYLIETRDATVNLDLINSWKLESQPEGMVADDELGFLYIGEEEKGIWKLDLNSADKEVLILAESQNENNPIIAYDIEGLSLYYGDENNDGFLLASIQGSFSYAVFDRISGQYLGSFIVKESGQFDGVEETDGLDISARQFPKPFSNGIVVIQDGFNYSNDKMVGQNFKYVALEDVLLLVKSFRKLAVND